MPSSAPSAQILKSVSRSFYLSLRVLPAAVRPAMGFGYALCRAADSIADTDAIPSAERVTTLRRFSALFDTFPVPREELADFARDVSEMNNAPASAEGRLLARIGGVIGAFNDLTSTDHVLIQQVVRAVIKGMEMDLSVFHTPDGVVRALARRTDLDNYLLWIGGEPGRFWSSVCREHLPPVRRLATAQWVQDGIDLGKGLQLINILRDMPADLKAGRCYVPLETLAVHGLKPADLLAEDMDDRFRTLYFDLIDEAVGYLEHGLAYVQRLPRRAVLLRAAAWWPLSIGLKTLERLRTSRRRWKDRAGIKVKRSEIYWMLASSFPMMPINAALAYNFGQRAKAASSALTQTR